MSNLFIEDLDRRPEQTTVDSSYAESSANRFREELAFGSEPKQSDWRGGATTEATGEEGTLPKHDDWRGSTERTGEEGSLPKSGDWRGHTSDTIPRIPRRSWGWTKD